MTFYIRIRNSVQTPATVSDAAHWVTIFPLKPSFKPKLNLNAKSGFKPELSLTLV